MSRSAEPDYPRHPPHPLHLAGPARPDECRVRRATRVERADRVTGAGRAARLERGHLVDGRGDVGQAEESTVRAGRLGPVTLEDLFLEQYGPMVRLAHLLTGSNQVAEDLVQDCLLRLHARWDRVENPGGYLRRSVVNACKSWHRGRAREEARLRLVGVDDAIGPEARELFDALGRLPYGQRAAIVLRYYQRCSEQEIAAALGCPPGTVKSHLHRGLAALRKVIDR